MQSAISILSASPLAALKDLQRLGTTTEGTTLRANASQHYDHSVIYQHGQMTPPHDDSDNDIFSTITSKANVSKIHRMLQEERNASENLPNLHASPSPKKSLTLLSPVQSFQYVQQVAKAQVPVSWWWGL